MRMRSAIACALLLALCGAAPAQGQDHDPLGGRYRPADAPGDAAGELRVEAEGEGWQAWFRGAPRRLAPVPEAELARTFGDVPAQAGLRCAAGSGLLLCAVQPGTRVAVAGDPGFVATTGYFATVAEAGLFHLRKLP